MITLEDLPSFIRGGENALDLVAQATRREFTVAALEKEYIAQILSRTGGNKARAAQILGMDRKTLYRKLRDYGMER
jgi:DNA-binding NtrC family response regulator